MRFDCRFARHFSHPHESFFSSGLSGESTPVHRQRLAFAASLRAKKKKKKNSEKKVRRRTGRRCQQQRGGKLKRASIMFYTLIHKENLPLWLKYYSQSIKQ